MPKFITYQRPTPINRQNWNGGPKQPTLPRRRPSEAKPAPALPSPDVLLKKE